MTTTACTGRARTLAACLALAAFAAPASADETAERELAELRLLVSSLSDRIEELERRLEEPKAESEPVPADSGRTRTSFESSDGRVELEVGGRIDLDFGFVSSDPGLEAAVGGTADGVAFRRARLSLSGRVGRRVGFEAEYDFAEDGSGEFKDLFVELRELGPIRSLKLGHLREPFGLDESSSSRSLAFLERSLPSALAPGRNTGLLLSSSHVDDRLTWAVGGFRDTDRFGRSAEGAENLQWTARLTGLPWRRDASHLLHLGVAFTRRHPDGNLLRLKEHPEVRLLPDFADTGPVPVTGSDERLGLELALVAGPVWFQAERAVAELEAATGELLSLEAESIQAGWFLTGESRRYRARRGSFGRVSPRARVFHEGGKGAWELAARWSRLDFDEGFVSGGRFDTLSLGLNWLLDDHLRVAGNWVRSELDGAGRSDAVVLRLELSF